MTSNKEIVKLKVALDKLKEKKKSVENNYFLATKSINDMIAKASNENEKEVAINKQSKLDDATNFAIQYLNKIINQIYLVLIEVIKNNQNELKKSKEVEEMFNQKLLEQNDFFNNQAVDQSQFQPQDFSDQYQNQDYYNNQYDNQYDQSYDPNYFGQNYDQSFDYSEYQNNVEQSVEQQPIEQVQTTTPSANFTVDKEMMDFVDKLLSSETKESKEEPKEEIVVKKSLSDEEFSIDDDNVSGSYRLNVIDENNLSIPVVTMDKLEDISEIKDETLLPSNMVTVKDETSKEILKQIEALDEMSRTELDLYLSEVEREIKADAPKNVKAGLMNDGEYVFDSKFKEMEEKLALFNAEIEALRMENKTISETNDTLFEMLRNKSEQLESVVAQQIPVTSVPNATQYFAALDNSVDTAITKLEKVATSIDPFINAISSEQIKNLENLSMPLIKSLEKTLENLSEDIKVLKQENSLYRKQIDESNILIQHLKEDSNRKEKELTDSYHSWMSSNRKLNDLENILSQQAIELDELDGSKNVIIENLENKLVDAKNFLDNVILEKQELIDKNEKLLDTIKTLRNIGFGESIDIDGHVETVSLQDIVEKEANRIVDDKISSLLEKYRDEIQTIKDESMVDILVDQQASAESEFNQAIRDSNPDEMDLMQKRILDFENKISNLEEKIKTDIRIKEKTSETIDELNSLLGIPEGVSLNQDTILNSKMYALEQKIGETLRKIDDIEEREKERKREEKNKISPQEIEDLVLSSDLYKNIRTELSQMEGRVIQLKEENKRVYAENQKINTELEDSFQKFAFNTAKVRDIENLLTKQSDEFAELSAEKDALILALEKALLENDFSYIHNLKDELNLSDFDNVNNFVEANVRAKKTFQEVEDMVSRKVNEMISIKFDELNSKYMNEIEAIHTKYQTMENEYTRLMGNVLSDQVLESSNDEENLADDLFKSDYTVSLIPEENLELNEYIEEQSDANQNNDVITVINPTEYQEFDYSKPEVEDVKEETQEEFMFENNSLEKPSNNQQSKLEDIIEEELESVSIKNDLENDFDGKNQLEENQLNLQLTPVTNNVSNNLETNNNQINVDIIDEIKKVLSSKLQDTIKTKDVVSNDDTLKNILNKNQELEGKINSIENLISSNFKAFQEQLNLVSSSNGYPTVLKPMDSPADLSDQIREIIDESTKIKFKEIQDASLNVLNDMKNEIKETLINEQLKQSESLQKNIDESFKVLGSKNTKELVNIKEEIGSSIEERESNRNLIEELQNRIQALEKENQSIKFVNDEKDMEINNSFIAWKNNNNKLEELENLFVILQNDMLAFEEDKIQFFNFLESVARKKIESSIESSYVKKFDNTSNRYFEDDIKPVVYYEETQSTQDLKKEIDEGVEKFSSIINEPQELIFEKIDEMDSIITSIVTSEDKVTDDDTQKQVDEYIEKTSNDLFENRKDEMLQKYDALLQKIDAKYQKLNETSFKAINDLSNKLKNIEDKIGSYSKPETSIFDEQIVKTEDKQIDDLKNKFDKLQKSYDDLLEKTKALELEKVDMTFESKQDDKKDDSATNYLISQLIESSNQLRRFEKMLLNLDSEINNVESYKLDEQE